MMKILQIMAITHNYSYLIEHYKWDVWNVGGACEMGRQNNNEAVLGRVGEGLIMLKLIRKRKINWLGYRQRRKPLLMDSLEGMV